MIRFVHASAAFADEIVLATCGLFRFRGNRAGEDSGAGLLDHGDWLECDFGTRRVHFIDVDAFAADHAFLVLHVAESFERRASEPFLSDIEVFLVSRIVEWRRSAQRRGDCLFFLFGVNLENLVCRHFLGDNIGHHFTVLHLERRDLVGTA